MTEEDMILTSILNCRRVDLVTNSQKLTDTQQSQLDQIIARRGQGEPLQYILGECDFMGMPLLVDKSVFIPRPETEILTELGSEQLKLLRSGEPLDILDLGTGSGNIAIALAKKIARSLITAVDISAESLALAQKNAKINQVDQKIEFLCKDMRLYLSEAQAQGLKFDMIISNPPYIPTEFLTQLPADVQHEPSLALDGGSDGLNFYRIILECGHAILKPHGFLLMEIGDDQSSTIETMFNKCPRYNNVSFHKDYVGTKRIVTAQLAKWGRVSNPPVHMCARQGALARE